MRLHVPTISHTIVSSDYSHCAFTQNFKRFAKMMRAQGATVIEYGNAGSESPADEHVVLRTRAEFDALYQHKPGECIQRINTNGPEHKAFTSSLLVELGRRARPGDFVVHGYGPVYSPALAAFPSLVHVEPFIGYDSGPFGAYRGFVTEAWRHYHLGRYTQHDAKAARESWVLPMFYDVEDWPLGEGKGGYFAFMARKCNAKGLKVLAEIYRRYDGPHHFRIAGPGEEWTDWAEFMHAINRDVEGQPKGTKRNTELVNMGCLPDKDRAKFLGDAVALLCPTQYVEPGGGVAIEAMMCGTPVIGSDWGCFTETLAKWARCRTVEDYLEAMNGVVPFERDTIRMKACNGHGLRHCGAEFVRVFEEMAKLRNVVTSA